MKKILLSCLCLLLCSQIAFSKENNQSSPLQKEIGAAKQLLSSGRPEECEAKVAEILRSDGTNTDALQLHAEALFQLHRYHFAADQAKEVLQAKPQDPEINLLLGKIYQSIHQPGRAVEFYNKYLQLAKASNITEQYKTLVQVLQDEAKSQSERHAEQRGKVGNYLSAVAGIGYMRWKDPQAIRVYVKSGEGVEGYRPEFEEALRQAFDDWTEATAGKIAFVFLPSAENAQMTVIWTSDLKAPALKAEAGLEKSSTGPDGLEKAEILLLTLNPFKEGPIGTNYLFNVCLHEIGHGLGLQGHSPYTEDIMSPQLYTQQGLSDRDVNTVLTLYSAERPSENLPDKDEWGRPLSPQIRSQHLVQAGTAAVMAGQYDKAIEKLESALELNPNNDLACKNISAAANNLAITPGTAPERQQSLLRLALYWQPQNQAARQNLDSMLQMAGKDPKLFAVRQALADQCASSGDNKGAIVEYREALSLKDDPAVKTKLNTLLAKNAIHPGGVPPASTKK